MSYRQEVRSTPTFETATVRHAALASVNDTVTNSHRRSGGSTPTAGKQRGMSAGLLIALSLLTHIVAASLIYSRLVGVLYSLIEDTPRLAVLERGLVRLLAASVYLPPFAPSILLIGAASWLASTRRERRVARMLSFGVVALAADTVMRMIGVLLAAPPVTVGELLDLPARFSPGPRMFAELLGIPIGGSGALYWSVVVSLAALTTIACASRALLFAEQAEADPAQLRRRRARGQTIAGVQHAVVSVVAFVLIAFIGQLALPLATQLFLRMFG